jgi:macrophage erythroblast attacher
MDRVIESSELSFVKAPYEQLNKTFRASQKSVEKDFAIIEKVLKDSSKKNLSQEDGIKLFDKISNKLKSLKRKVFFF